MWGLEVRGGAWSALHALRRSLAIALRRAEEARKSADRAMFRGGRMEGGARELLWHMRPALVDQLRYALRDLVQLADTASERLRDLESAKASIDAATSALAAGQPLHVTDPQLDAQVRALGDELRAASPELDAPRHRPAARRAGQGPRR
jgi:hypothetical protein